MPYSTIERTYNFYDEYIIGSTPEFSPRGCSIEQTRYSGTLYKLETEKHWTTIQYTLLEISHIQSGLINLGKLKSNLSKKVVWWMSDKCKILEFLVTLI